MELHMEERGSGPPVLLIHGTGGYSGLFEPLSRELETTHRAIAYDRRGFARSAGTRAKDFHGHADDAAALLEELGASPATVVAWSGGGMVGLDLAASHPHAVATLVLVEPAFHLLLHPVPSALRMSMASNFQRLVRRDRRAAAEVMYRWASGYTNGGNAFDAYPAQWREAMLGHASTTLFEMDQLTRFRLSREQLRRIECPVTCVMADRSDRAFHKSVRALLRHFPSAKVERVEGSSHMIPTDQPGRLAVVIRGLQ
jgi:pimeloyl-ACP methyl ester carboxylesterase